MRSASQEGFFQNSKYSTSNLVWQPIQQIQGISTEQRYNQQRVPYYEKQQQTQNSRQNYRIVSNSIDSKQELFKNNQNNYDSQYKHGLIFERNHPEKASFSTTANNDTANIPTFELGQETSESLLQIVDQINTNQTFQQDISKRVSANCKYAINEMEELKKQLFPSQEVDQKKQREKVTNTDQKAISIISRDQENKQTPQYLRSRQNSATHYHQQAQSTQSASALCQFPQGSQLAQRQHQLQPPNSQIIQINNSKETQLQSMVNARQKSHSFNTIATNQTSLSSSFVQHSTRKSSCESTPVGSSVVNISTKTFYDPHALLQKKLEKNKQSNYNYDNLLKEELPVFCVNCERYVQLACLERHSTECLNPERSQVSQKSKEKNGNEEEKESFEKINDDLIRIELQIIKRLEKAKNQQEQALKFALKISQTVREVYELEKIEQSLMELKKQRAILSIEFISELILYDRLILLFWQKMKALGFKQHNLIGIKQTLEPRKYLNCCQSDQKYKESVDSKSTLKNSFQSYSEKNNRQQAILNNRFSNYQAQTDFTAKFSSNVLRRPFVDFASIGGGTHIQKQIMI